MPNIAVERVESPTEEAHALIAALERELDSHFPQEQSHGLTLDQVFEPQVRFFVARLDGVAGACGAVVADDGFAELKRMYVVPALRGRGLVQAILARLEAEARAQGYTRIMLETGDMLHSAIGAYERAGFRRRAAFGEYLTMAPLAVARSVYFEKRIG